MSTSIKSTLKKDHQLQKAINVIFCNDAKFLNESKIRHVTWMESKALISKQALVEASNKNEQRKKCTQLVNQLLLEIYSHNSSTTTDYNSDNSSASNGDPPNGRHLFKQDIKELKRLVVRLEKQVIRTGETLARKLKRKDALRRQMDARCDAVSFLLRRRVSQECPQMMKMRFSLEPKLSGSATGGASSSGFSQWHSAMKMVTQLPEGIPVEFRRQMWLSLADKHIEAKNINWHRVENECFSEWSHPADGELGVQIVKDLHRTGCSLFCGKDGQKNQALLKRVLLAYARWNKSVGYCQGFNMLAALILQVTEKNESDALKLMVYLIEGVLPDSYFADSLRGLSVDMAVFRELLRTKLPKLSRHLDKLQSSSKDGSTISYEPPLTNVFTMQWFLTLFCNCLPQPTVLRVWDLILLEGNDVLLRTALAIWQTLADRIVMVRSADEFYSVMGILMQEVLEYDHIDANTLISKIVQIGPLHELRSLREHYLYNINPWGSSPNQVNRMTHERNKRKADEGQQKILLDIGILKKQYAKLKQRQRQAHVIFNSAVSSTGRRTKTQQQQPNQSLVPVNHLLQGKSALVPAKKSSGPPKGAIPPAMRPKSANWKEVNMENRISAKKTTFSSSSSSSDTELCDDPSDVLDDEAVGNRTIQNNSVGNKPVENSEVLDSPDVIIPIENPVEKLLFESNLQKDLLDDLGDLTEDLVLDSTSSCCKEDNLVDLSDQQQHSTPETDQAAHVPQILMNDLHEEEEVNKVVDFFDSIEDNLAVEKVHRSHSLPSDDGFDFEKFLQERVQALQTFTIDTKRSSASEESLEEFKGTQHVGRRSSVRALEIIQENSLILHRILQCQSRLTPTPPPQLDFDYDDDENDDKNSNQDFGDINNDFDYEDRSKWSFTPSPLEFQDSWQQIETTEDIKSAFVEDNISDRCSSSQPSEIPTVEINHQPLEVSKITTDSQKILSENFDLLRNISRDSKQKTDNPVLETKPDTVGNLESRVNLKEDGLIEIDKNSKYNSILEYSRDLDEKFINLIVKGNKAMLKSNYSLDLPSTADISLIKDHPKPSQSYSDFSIKEEENSSTPALISNQDNETDEATSDCKNLTCEGKSSLVTSPFPVNISSRQSKDFAIGLGLYKK